MRRLTVETEQEVLKAIERLLEEMKACSNQAYSLYRRCLITEQEKRIIDFKYSNQIFERVLDTENINEMFFDSILVMEEFEKFNKLWEEKPEVIKLFLASAITQLCCDTQLIGEMLS